MTTQHQDGRELDADFGHREMKPAPEKLVAEHFAKVHRSIRDNRLAAAIEATAAFMQRSFW